MTALLDKIKQKFSEISLTLAGLLVFLQILVGTGLDIFFGLLIVGLLYLSNKWR